MSARASKFDFILKVIIHYLVIFTPKIIKKLLFILFFFSFSINLSSQIKINELCSSNRSVLSDSYGETPDWIELYNDSNEMINLDGFYISDDELEWNKYQLPDVELSPFSFVLIYASSRDEFTDEIHANFKLSSLGEGVFLSNNDGELIDAIETPSLNVDFSYGRKEDGEDEWVFFDMPSPDTSNVNSSPYLNLLAPSLNFKSGVYFEEINVSLSSNPNDFIARYTIDGTRVNKNSPIFNELNVSETTNLRIAYFDENDFKGNEFNAIYFFESFHQLPVAHISVDNEKVFDEIIGVFEKGPDADTEYPFYGANFWKDLEIPISFTYFENDELKVDDKLAMKIHGGKASRTNPMHSIRLIADVEYGTEEMNFQFFPESENTRFKRLVLRNASGDYNYTHFRDGYLARYFAKEKLDLDLIQFRPTVVYINGEYYGLHHLREKIDKYYIEEHYGFNEDEIDLLEKDTQVVEGDFDIFNEHLSFLLENDLSVDTNFDVVSKNFDVNHFMDYFAAQSIVNNTDWPRNNIKYWRAKDGGKWRYFLFDMDVAMGRHGWTVADQNYMGEWIDTLSNARFYDIMKKLWENENYKNDFITRYCDLLNSTFKSEKWTEETVHTKTNLEPEIERQFEVWSDGRFEWWQETAIPNLYDFTEQREDYARSFLGDRFELDNAENITISVDPPSAGYFEVNTLEVHELPWDGYYFGELESSLVVHPNPGFTFSHWEIIGNVETNINVNKLDIRNFDDLEVIAHFEGAFQGPNTFIYPNPSSGEISIEFINNANSPVTISVYDNLGRLVYTEIIDDLFAGDNELNVNLSNLENGIYFLELDLEEYKEIKKILIQNEN